MSKIKKILIFLIPIFIISIGLITFFAVSMIKKNNDNNQQIVSTKNDGSVTVDLKNSGADQNSSGVHGNNSNMFKNTNDNFYDQIKYFPELDSSEFYSYIRMNEKTDMPIINKETIQYMINYIVKNMPQISGEVSVGYKQDNLQSVKIQVKFIPDGSSNEYHKTYLFTTINSI